MIGGVTGVLGAVGFWEGCGRLGMCWGRVFGIVRGLGWYGVFVGLGWSGCLGISVAYLRFVGFSLVLRSSRRILVLGDGGGISRGCCGVHFGLARQGCGVGRACTIL